MSRKKPVASLDRAVRAKGCRERTPSLSPREIQVLSWAARGKCAFEIAAILKISKRTVDAHAQTAVQKLSAANRMHAVAIAVRDHLIDL